MCVCMSIVSVRQFIMEFAGALSDVLPAIEVVLVQPLGGSPNHSLLLRLALLHHELPVPRLGLLPRTYCAPFFPFPRWTMMDKSIL